MVFQLHVCTENKSIWYILQCNKNEDNTTCDSGGLLVFSCHCVKMALSKTVNPKLLLTASGWHDRSAANSLCERVHVLQTV